VLNPITSTIRVVRFSACSIAVFVELTLEVELMPGADVIKFGKAVDV